MRFSTNIHTLNDLVKEYYTEQLLKEGRVVKWRGAQTRWGPHARAHTHAAIEQNKTESHKTTVQA